MAVQRGAPNEMPNVPYSEQVALTGPSENITVYQLAARWAERYAGESDDLRAMLDRFRSAYVYLDALTHGLEPPSE